MSCLISLVVLASPSFQQCPPEIRSAVYDPKVQAALEFVDTQAENAAEFLAEIGAIISPSGKEHERAETVLEVQPRNRPTEAPDVNREVRHAPRGCTRGLSTH